MTAETLQMVRFLIVYPVLAVTAAGWSVLSWLRFRQDGRSGDFWSAQIGMALVIWSVLSLVGLWLATRMEFALTANALVTAGSGLTAVVVATAVVVSLARAWRLGSGQ